MPVLSYQFKRNPNVTILQKAMGAIPSRAKLNFTGTDSTASMRDDWPFPNEQILEVEVSTLDSLIAEYGRPKLIKVDVEGFELEVFKGLSQAVPLIYFEMHGHEYNETLQILKKLSDISEIVGIKVISGDNSSWLINEWVDLDEVAIRLGNPLPKQANIIVKMKV
jgi:Methyltransferase FkbM domain